MPHNNDAMTRFHQVMTSLQINNQQGADVTHNTAVVI
jgi:hypothetical protein